MKGRWPQLKQIGKWTILVLLLLNLSVVIIGLAQAQAVRAEAKKWQQAMQQQLVGWQKLNPNNWLTGAAQKLDGLDWQSLLAARADQVEEWAQTIINAYRPINEYLSRPVLNQERLFVWWQKRPLAGDYLVAGINKIYSWPLRQIILPVTAVKNQLVENNITKLIFHRGQVAGESAQLDRETKNAAAVNNQINLNSIKIGLWTFGNQIKNKFLTLPKELLKRGLFGRFDNQQKQIVDREIQTANQPTAVTSNITRVVQPVIQREIQVKEKVIEIEKVREVEKLVYPDKTENNATSDFLSRNNMTTGVAGGLWRGDNRFGGTISFEPGTIIDFSGTNIFNWPFSLGGTSVNVVSLGGSTGASGSGSGSSGVSDHGALTGLTDDDHPQYGDLSQNEVATGAWTFSGDLNVADATSTGSINISGSLGLN